MSDTGSAWVDRDGPTRKGPLGAGIPATHDGPRYHGNWSVGMQRFVPAQEATVVPRFRLDPPSFEDPLCHKAAELHPAQHLASCLTPSSSQLYTPGVRSSRSSSYMERFGALFPVRRKRGRSTGSADRPPPSSLRATGGPRSGVRHTTGRALRPRLPSCVPPRTSPSRSSAPRAHRERGGRRWRSGHPPRSGTAPSPGADQRRSDR